MPSRKGKDMEIFHMWDVISLLGIPMPPSGKSAYYVPCPNCDTSPRKKHLNINLRKEVFRCPRCGISGGIFDLYALYTGVPRDKVRKALVEKLGVPEKAEGQKRQVKQQLQEDSLMADVDTRHETYHALLSKLSLATDHKENLLGRGLKEKDIERLGYKTTPVVGMTAIARQLYLDGYCLNGIPGFYQEKEDVWTFVHEQRGILIPVKDSSGRIQGLQIRRDNVQKRKFRWVSSSERTQGCRAEGWTHLAGPACQKILLTEGPMKADVIFSLTGMTVLAVPGVNALTQLERALLDLREKGMTEIMTAFDMDFTTNHYVQNGYKNLLALLEKMGIRFGTYLWNPEYKGLDDYIWSLQHERETEKDTDVNSG